MKDIFKKILIAIAIAAISFGSNLLINYLKEEANRKALKKQAKKYAKDLQKKAKLSYRKVREIQL